MTNKRLRVVDGEEMDGYGGKVVARHRHRWERRWRELAQNSLESSGFYAKLNLQKLVSSFILPPLFRKRGRDRGVITVLKLI